MLLIFNTLQIDNLSKIIILINIIKAIILIITIIIRIMIINYGAKNVMFMAKNVIAIINI